MSKTPPAQLDREIAAVLAHRAHVEWALVSDEGVVEDGFYSREAAENRLRAMGEEGEDLKIDRRDLYDAAGNWISEEDEG